MERDYNTEAKAPNYAHQFDYLMHFFMARTFTPHVAQFHRALEMGCYHGHFTKLLARYFPKVAVIEASQECIDAATENIGDGNARTVFFHGTFEDLEFDAQYENIFLIHTLEHLDNPDLVLKRAKEWLAPGGRFFIAVPNAYAASRQIAVKMGLIDHCEDVTLGEKAMGHRRTYSMDTLKLAVWHAGLNIVAEGGIMLKYLSNGQIDRALQAGIIDQKHLEGCYELGKQHPQMCASIYVVCENP